MRENIRVVVLKYGPNEVRSVRKTKARIFSRMNRINWSIRAFLESQNQRPKPSLNSELNIFVSSLNVAVGREIFFDSSISIKVKFSFKKTKTCVKIFCCPCYLLIEVGLRFSGPIRLWTDR